MRVEDRTCGAFVMTHKHIFKIIGDGDVARGKAICADLAWRLKHARTKHEWTDKTPFYAVDVVQGEVDELMQAAMFETPERLADEALDVMATATRAYNREWENVR